MKFKKSFAGVAVMLALFIGVPQVSAEDVEVFGGSSDEEKNSETAPFQDDDGDFVEENADLGPDLIFNDPKEEIPEEDSKDTKKDAESEKDSDKDKETSDTEKISNNDKDTSGDEKNFDKGKKTGNDAEFDPFGETPPPNVKNPNVIQPPVTENNFVPDKVSDKNDTDSKSNVLVIDTPSYRSNDNRILPPSRVNDRIQEREKKMKMKTQKPRFIKIMIDENFTYYLDKQSVQWQRVPYSASEYMLSVWLRMIEHNADTSDLPDDMSNYLNDTTNGEILVAAENGKAFAPSDVEVLQHKKFFLEHYYVRPKAKQVQFLCELEVVGHPQNTISERAYDYQNWENLVPGSIEQIVYTTTMKEFGKSGSSDKGHMSFADMFDEYLRVSLR